MDRVTVSDLCDEYQIAPSVFYAWQKQALDAMAQTLEHRTRKNDRESALVVKAEQRIAALEAKLVKKDSVIAEIQPSTCN